MESIQLEFEFEWQGNLFDSIQGHHRIPPEIKEIVENKYHQMNDSLSAYCSVGNNYAISIVNDQIRISGEDRIPYAFQEIW